MLQSHAIENILPADSAGTLAIDFQVTLEGLLLMLKAHCSSLIFDLPVTLTIICILLSQMVFYVFNVTHSPDILYGGLEILA